MARRATRWALWALLSCATLAGAACSSGKDGGCSSGQVQCGGCYDPAHYQSDPFNCGGCGIACGPAGTCVNGQCACAGGATRCDALVPRCRDLQTDTGACGSCATSCSVQEVGWTCQAGQCGCFGDRTECGTICTNTSIDPRNCGAGQAGCGNACKPGDICGSTPPTCQCLPPLADCPTACTNTQTDVTNCGFCGNVCTADAEVCSSGVCTCPAFQPDRCPAVGAPAACVNKMNDAQNCGACSNACPAGATCTSGNCQCPAGAIPCANVCVPCAGGACGVGATCSCPPPGPPSGCNGRCCAGGDTCCGNGNCQTQHSNGLGQSYFDCNFLYAPNQTTLQAATAAAGAWPPGAGGTTIPGACQPFCIGRQTAAQTQCAVWCYAGSTFQGLVGLNTSNGACLCPGVASQTQTWN